MPVTSRVELFAAIRRDARAGMSGRAIERKHGVGYRTVAQALGSAWPQQRKEYAPRPSKLDPFKAAVDEILLADLDASRKQRHTITRIYHSPGGGPSRSAAAPGRTPRSSRAHRATADRPTEIETAPRR